MYACVCMYACIHVCMRACVSRAAYRARHLKFPMPRMTSAGAHNSARYAYYRGENGCNREGQSDRGLSTFSGSPALIPDLILPVEVGIGGGPINPQQHLILQVITAGIDNSHVSDNLKLVAVNISEWLSLCWNSKFHCASRGHARCMQTCTPFCYFWHQMWLLVG